MGTKITIELDPDVEVWLRDRGGTLEEAVNAELLNGYARAQADLTWEEELVLASFAHRGATPGLAYPGVQIQAGMGAAGKQETYVAGMNGLGRKAMIVEKDGGYALTAAGYERIR
jgi:hypothetical protein